MSTDTTAQPCDGASREGIMRQFAAGMLISAQTDLAADNVRVASITFSDHATLDFDFARHASAAGDVINAVLAGSNHVSGPATLMHTAFKLARSSLLTEDRGIRNDGVTPLLLLIFSDGDSLNRNQLLLELDRCGILPNNRAVVHFQDLDNQTLRAVDELAGSGGLSEELNCATSTWPGRRQAIWDHFSAKNIVVPCLTTTTTTTTSTSTTTIATTVVPPTTLSTTLAEPTSSTHTSISSTAIRTVATTTTSAATTAFSAAQKATTTVNCVDQAQCGRAPFTQQACTGAVLGIHVRQLCPTMCGLCSVKLAACTTGEKNCGLCSLDESACTLCIDGTFLHEGMCISACPASEGFVPKGEAEGTTGRSCSKDTGGPCTDEHPECTRWSNKGYCSSSPGFMRTQCRASCQLEGC